MDSILILSMACGIARTVAVPRALRLGGEKARWVTSRNVVHVVRRFFFNLPYVVVDPFSL